MTINHTIDFAAILNAKRNAIPAPPRPANKQTVCLATFKGISAEEFLRGCNRTRSQEQIKNLISSYIGIYRVDSPFGVQYDNARMRAHESLRAANEPPAVRRVPRSPNYPGRVIEALSLGRDAQRRLSLLSATDNTEPTEAIRASLRSQREQAATVLGAYLQNEGIEFN